MIAQRELHKASKCTIMCLRVIVQILVNGLVMVLIGADIYISRIRLTCISEFLMLSAYVFVLGPLNVTDYSLDKPPPRGVGAGKIPFAGARVGNLRTR